jgi:tetratricopeptide (TPR) repeat protein
MRIGLSVLVLTFLVAPALADIEEICLADGRTGIATVLGTTKDAVSLEFVKAGGKVKLTIPAARLDSNCFYNLRRRNMEKTAENHLQLAIWCAKQGMWNRGQLQYDIAVALDEAYVEKIKATPGMREGIADSIIEAAKKWYGAGEVEKAGMIAERVLARFGDTPAAIEAQTLIGLVEEKRREAEEKAAAAELAAMDEAAKKEAAKVERAIKPLKATHELGMKLYDRAIKETNESHARRSYISAAKEFMKVLTGIDRLKIEVDPTQVERAKKRVRGDAVRALLKAGNIDLHRGSWKNATEMGKKALEVDPGNAAATAFIEEIAMAEAMDDTFDSRYNRRRRSYGAPNRVGTGGGGGRRR